MAVFGRFTRSAAPTVTDPAMDAAESPIDEEKGIEKASHHEAVDAQPTRHHVAPDVEKRVVRKLDMHAMPLIAVLCAEHHCAMVESFR